MSGDEIIVSFVNLFFEQITALVHFECYTRIQIETVIQIIETLRYHFPVRLVINSSAIKINICYHRLIKLTHLLTNQMVLQNFSELYLSKRYRDLENSVAC